MRKLIVRAFNISLDGVNAEYGTEYFDWCMSGIDPRVSEGSGRHHLPADDSLLDPTGELYLRAYAWPARAGGCSKTSASTGSLTWFQAGRSATGSSSWSTGVTASPQGRRR
jgi:hypothetical protein